MRELAREVDELVGDSAMSDKSGRTAVRAGGAVVLNIKNACFEH